MNDQRAASLHNSVIVMSADGSGRRVVYGEPTRNSLAPAWSSKGDMIAFGVGQFLQAIHGAATADIAVIRTDGTGFRLFTTARATSAYPVGLLMGDASRIARRARGTTASASWTSRRVR